MTQNENSNIKMIKIVYLPLTDELDRTCEQENIIQTYYGTGTKGK